MERVGWIFTHNEDKDLTYTTEEILKIAENQLKYGPHFVTISVQIKEESKSRKISGMRIVQVSEKFVELYKKGIFKIDEEDKKKFSFNKRFIITRIKNTKKKKVESIVFCCLGDTENFKFNNDRFLSLFPPKNRSTKGYKQSMDKVKSILKKNIELIDKVNDFHLLLYLSDYLSMENDIPALCDAILNKKYDTGYGFEQLIGAYCGLD